MALAASSWKEGSSLLIALITLTPDLTLRPVVDQPDCHAQVSAGSCGTKPSTL